MNIDTNHGGEMMYLKLEDPSMFEDDSMKQPQDHHANTDIYEDSAILNNLLNDEHFTTPIDETTVPDNANNISDTTCDYSDIAFGRTLPIDPDSIQENNIIDSMTLTDYVNLNSNELPYELIINDLPHITRVENQLKLTLKFNNLPKDTKKFVYLPTNTISRQKFYLNSPLQSLSQSIIDQTLSINTFLLVNDEFLLTSPKIVDVCMKCVQREQRRASRRKSGLSDNLLWCDNPRRSAILFNDKQLLKIENNEINLTTRIVCYCRHHKANEGFKILIVITDPTDNNKILAKNFTSSIIITDRKPSSITNKTDLDLLTDSVPTLSNFTNSRNSSNNITTTTTTMTNLPKKYIPSPNSLSETGGSESFTSEYVSATYQDYSSSATTADFLPRQDSMNFNNIPFSTSGTTNTAAATVVTNPRKRSHLNITSSIPSNPSFINDFNQQFDSTHYFTGQQQQPDPNQPILQRVIPAKGPTSGGIEVTLLGSNFKDGLKVKFGNNLALSTQCWNDSTMVTYLPPTQSPGQVIVTIQDPDNELIDDQDRSINSDPSLLPFHNNNSTLQNSIFTYTDETDRQLIELALQIVGLKMNGKLDDARNIAKKIVGTGDNTNDDPSPGNSTNNNITNQYNYNNELNDENLIIQVIKSMNRTTTHLSMCDTLGRTLLHLATVNGYYNLSLLLIKSGVHLDVEDSFGFTPLHFAAIGGDYKVINLLLSCKAHINLKDNKHQTPRQMFINNNFISKTKDSYFKIISLFDKYEDKISNIDKLSRISSHSSMDSSIFNEDMNENAQMIGINHIQNQPIRKNSDDDDDAISYVSDCDLEDNISFSENESDDIAISQRATAASIDTTSQVPRLETTIDETSEEANNATKRQSLWGRMLTHLNDDLPSYDDLFPRLNSKTTDDLKINEPTNVMTIQDNDSSQDTHIGSSTSEDDEEDLIQVKLNKFFIKQKKTFQNDNMLLFFWIPLTLLLLTFVLFNSFYQGNDSSIINKSTDIIRGYIMVGLGKIWLGNQRMKNYVTENLNNFPTTKKLNDLIVG
ncbi:hypothetical protein C6P45_000081 [Maudiozyma exigua]|uniref:IPT/TIG domain-containing protein n=1 Tax=Maudiozyma exigua TaxID=34358 RepID=A0A9P6WHU1_MAUEX|nr:hypothetical protein C6P45_000081 [Kazachstania exigua]